MKRDETGDSDERGQHAKVKNFDDVDGNTFFTMSVPVPLIVFISVVLNPLYKLSTVKSVSCNNGFDS